MNDQEMVQKHFNEAWEFSVGLKKLSKNETPQAFVLGGQPGAGKSHLIANIEKELNNDVIVINGDDYRKFHPSYIDFQKKYKKDAPLYTATFAGLMTEAMLKRAIIERYNVVIEGTFRTSETPIKTLEFFKENNYSRNVHIKTCSEKISWNNCIKRYNNLLAISPLEARYTKKEHHDLVVKNLADNVAKVMKSGLVDRLKIFEREKLIFDSSNDKNFKSEIIKNVLKHQKENNKQITNSR